MGGDPDLGCSRIGHVPHGCMCKPGGMTRISSRIAAIGESPTLAVDAKAKALQAAGESVINFGAGEPDFPTPDHVVAAAEAACRDPRNHRYTPAPGLPELREAVAAKTARDSGYAVAPSQVLVTNGGKQAVYEAFATLLDPGDEVIVPAPYWVTYPEAIALAGGVAVPVATTIASGFRVIGRAARGGPDGADQGPAVRVAVQPHRRGLHAGRDRGDRAVGGRAWPVGRHRRDLRAPGVRRRPLPLGAGGGSGGGRSHDRDPRRGQDLRHDRAGGSGG